MNESIIELNVPIVEEEAPDTTHKRMCNIKFEEVREEMLKPGFIEIWFARCHKDGESYIETENLGGNFISLVDTDYLAISNILKASIRDINQWLIDNNKIESGTVLGD